MTYTLYNYWRSSASWRVRIALAHKNLPYEYLAMSLVEDGGHQFRAEYRAKNPMAQLPTLAFPSDGGTVELAQSLAIMEYLDEVHPEPPLLPRDPVLRARVRQLAEIVNSGIQPLQNLMVTNHVEALAGGGEAGVRAKNAWLLHFLTHGLIALEAVARPLSGKFLVGDTVSLADICLVPQLYSARRFAVPLDAYPTLTRVDALCATLPAFVAAHGEHQPDAPKPAAKESR